MGLAGVGGEWEVSWVVGAKARFFSRVGAYVFCGCCSRTENRVVAWGVRSGLLWKGGACGVAEGRLPSRVGYCPKTGIEICR